MAQKRWKPLVRRTLTQKTGFNLEVRVDPQDVESTVNTMADGFAAAVQSVMREVVSEDILPYIEAQYFSKNFRDYSPIFVNSKGEEFNTYDMGNYERGFMDLGRELKKVEFNTTSSGSPKGIGFRLGGRAGQMSIESYTAFGDKTGTTDRDSWFLAVELGTGIADNIPSGEVFTSGRTKADSPSGAWFFGPTRGGVNTGPKFLGQRGFNIFWEDGNAYRPADFWLKVFNERIPMRLTKKLAPFRRR